MKHIPAFIFFSGIILCLWAITPAWAQILPPPPAQTPIDGGLSLLAAAGAGYAAHKLRKKRRTSSNPKPLE